MKVKIEIQITLLVLAIAAAIVTIGYFSYRNIAAIVESMHQAARPDQTRIYIKNIEAGLSELENQTRYYILKNENDTTWEYNQLRSIVADNLHSLSETDFQDEKIIRLIDSIQTLAYDKLEIWGQVVELHHSSLADTDPDFNEVYSKLNYQRIDTVMTETKKKGFLKRLFSSQKVDVDTSYVKQEVGKDEIRRQLQDIEAAIREKDQSVKNLESILMAQNIEIDKQLKSLIKRYENIESERFRSRTGEVDDLAQETFHRLAVFSAGAGILLLLTLALLFNFIHRSRKYQRMLDKAKTEALNLARSKEQFAAHVSHEIRTPVNAILGLSDLILQSSLGEKEREKMVVVRNSAIHLRNIVNNTLDFTKMETAKLTLSEVDFLLADELNEVIAIQKSEAGIKGLQFIAEFEGEINSVLRGDPLRLKQILLNLIGNSLKFTEKGFIKLSVGLSKPVKERLWLNIIVEDSGIGIVKEKQKIIFDEYVQADQSAGNKSAGTGLGLSIVKKLTELQGGKISIESEKGSGTRFFVEIPYKPGDKTKLRVEGPAWAKVPDYFQNLTILVADDEEYNRFLIKNIFEKWGAKYRLVSNGEEAIGLAIAQDFDLILLDINMPVKDGFEASRAIRSGKSSAQIVAITASTSPAVTEKCFASGMVGFLPKPFTEEELIKVVEEFTHAGKEKAKPQFDFEELKRLANNDPAFMKEMLEIFVRSSENGIEAIENGLVSGNVSEIAGLAHKIKSPAKHIGATVLVGLLAGLEKNAETAGKEELVETIGKIKIEAAAVNAYIREYLKDH
jgi:signal transduction histidine kinase/DNA-binding NarL/FixJ family response regulator